MRKKIIAMLLASAMVVSLAACGSGSGSTETTAAASETTEAAVSETTEATDSETSEAAETEAQTETVLGELAQIGITEEEVNARNAANDLQEAPEGAEEGTEGTRKHYDTVKFFDTFNALQLAFTSGQVDAIQVPKVVADYMAAQGMELSMSVEKISSYSMLTADFDLMTALSDAITALKEDGTMDSLIVKYLTSGATMDAVEFETFDGADTVTFAVTGDLPPFDYTDEAGNAAGFNTAVIAAVAAKMGVNVEIIQVDSGARAMALSTGKADAVFWMSDDTVEPNAEPSLDYSSENLETGEAPADVPAPMDVSGRTDDSPADENLPAKTDAPEGTYLTEAFFLDYNVIITKN